MEKNKTLFTLSEGSCGTVTCLCSESSMRRRLRDIGLVEGTPVLCLQRAASGSIAAYLIRGTVFALRSEDSEKVMIN